MKTVTAADANRQFSAVLRQVAQGESVVITSRGTPVATIQPVPARASRSRAGAAKRRLLEHLSSVKAAGTRDWARDELYD